MDAISPTPGPAVRLPFWKRFGLHIRGRLVAGFFLLVPIGLSIMVVQFLFNILDVFIKPVVALVPKTAPYYLRDWMPQLVFVLFVYLSGLAVSLVFGKKIVKLVDGLFLKIPGIKIVYAASKQLMESLSQTNAKTGFQSVVIIDCFFPGFKTVGFLTGSVRNAKGELFHKIFLPTAPNPTSGYLLVVPAEKVYFSSMDVETAFNIIVSGGMLSPDVMDLPKPDFGAPDQPSDPRQTG